MIMFALFVALIFAVIALELRYRIKRTNYIQRKEIDQIRAFRSKQR